MQGEAEFLHSYTSSRATDISEVFPPLHWPLDRTQDYAWLP